MIKRLLTATALALVTAGPLAAFDVENMTPAEREAFGAAVRAYLLDQPQVLMEAIEVLESRQAEEQAANDEELLQVNAEEIFNDPGSWVGGNPEGDITIVEFLDYRCGYCRKAHPEVAELIAADGNIRLVVKEYPILGEESLLASRFALGVKEVQGDEAYKEINDELMNFRGSISEKSLSDLSELMGYDTPAVFAAMNGEAVQTAIGNTRALAQRLGISGTPSFVFQGQMIRGYVPLEGMLQIVAEERNKG